MNEIHSSPQFEEIQESERIGGGGEGTIHLAEWRGQTIVVKKPHNVNSPSLTKELYVFQTVIHPHILHFLGQEPSTGWLLLPYMKNGSLDKLLLSKEPLWWDRRIRFSSDIADGLQFLHDKCKILHCDIKSANVLIDDNDRAKIADFGTVQIEKHPEWHSWGATVEYWSPELRPWIKRLPPSESDSELLKCFPKSHQPLIGKLPPFSKKSDVYALGVLFWEIAERSLALQEVLGGAYFQSSKSVPSIYKKWIQSCRAKDPENRPSANILFEELSNKETQNALIKEAEKRLAFTLIVLEEDTPFKDLFTEMRKFPGLEQRLFPIKPLQNPLTTQDQKELQEDIDTLLKNFLLLKEKPTKSALKNWQLDSDDLLRKQIYWKEMNEEQRQMLLQIVCQYGYWVTIIEMPEEAKTYWMNLEKYLLKERATKNLFLSLGEIRLYSGSERSLATALLHMAEGPENRERQEYAKTMLILSFLWQTFQNTLETNTQCRFYEIAKQSFQLLIAVQEQFGSSKNPFIQESLPLFFKSSSASMEPFIPRIHKCCLLLLREAQQESIEEVEKLLETDLLQWFQYYRAFQKWEWISQFQTEVLQPALEPDLKSAYLTTFEEIANTCILPWLKRYSKEKELKNLAEESYNWIRELSHNNLKVNDFHIKAFRKQMEEIEDQIDLQAKQNIPPLWQTLSQKRQDYKDPKDYTKAVIETLDKALAFCLPFLGDAPSHWALIGLGSLGRGQLFPYSGLDIAFLVENEEVRTDPYWQRLLSLLETLTQLMDDAGSWDHEKASYVWMGHHIDARDKQPFMVQTPTGCAHWAVQALHKLENTKCYVVPDDGYFYICQNLSKEKDLFAEFQPAYSYLHPCLISSTGKGLLFEYQTKLKEELKGKINHSDMALACQKEHAREWQIVLLLEENLFERGISIKDGVFAPLNNYLLDHELSGNKLDPCWLSIVQEAWKEAFKLRQTLEQRAKKRVLSVKREADELKLTESEYLLIERLHGIGVFAYSAVLNDITDPLTTELLVSVHLKKHWVTTGLAATLTFGKGHDLKIHRKLYRLMPQEMRIEYEKALNKYSKISPQAKHLLKKILPSVPLPNGMRGNFQARKEKWEKIIVSLVEPCDLKNIPQETTGVLVSWVENHQIRHGVLQKEFAQQLIDGKGQFRQDKKLKDGRRSVIPLYDKNNEVIVYPKAYPELPGRQLAGDCLAYRITGSSVQASLVLFTPIQKGRLNEKTAYPVLLSKPAGITIQDIERKKEFTQKISSYHFTLKAIVSYVLGYEDDKKDNVTLEPTIDEIGNPCSQPTTIDGDHLFSSPMVDTTTASKVLLKTVTFMFPEMDKPLNPEAVADFLSLNRDEVLSEWLNECDLLNKSLIGNFKKKEGLFKPELVKKWAFNDKWFGSNNFSYIPIAFEMGTMADIYQRWGRVESSLRAKTLPSNHFDFLRQVAPRLTDIYQKIFNEHLTVSKRFDVLAELYTDYKITKEKGEISCSSTQQVNISKTLVGTKNFQEALTKGKIFDASESFGGKELKDIQTHYKYSEALKKIFKEGIDVDDKKQQMAIKKLEILIAKPYYTTLVERVLSQIRFHYTETNRERLLAFQDKLLNLLSQKSLQHLSLVGWHALTEEKFVKLIEKSPDLQSLSLIDCPNFRCSGATWKKLSVTCPQLKEIRVSGVVEMPTSLWFTDVKFEKLQSLYLEDCPELPFYKIRAPKLQQLTLKNCKDLIDVNLEGLPIQRLRLYNCEQICGESLYHNIQGQHLQSISIKKCPKIKLSKVYIQYPFLIGQVSDVFEQGEYCVENEINRISLILNDLKLQPHEIPVVALFVLELSKRVRNNIFDFDSYGENCLVSYLLQQEITKLRELLKNFSSSSTLLVEKEEEVEIIGNQKGPIWYSDDELEHLLRLQLPLETNRSIYLLAGAKNEQQLKDQLLYACSAQSLEKPTISLIPIFLNAEENAFHQVGNHWTILMLVNVPSQNQKSRQVAIYQNPMGLEMPDSICQLLQEWELFDLKVKQQTNDNDCGPWVVHTVQVVVEELQESFPLVLSKEGMQKWITPFHVKHGMQLRRLYDKQLQKKRRSLLKMVQIPSPPTLPFNQDDHDSDGKEDIN